MKILFLDFDGVLNSEKYVKNSNEFGVVIDPERMILLKQIIDSTGAKIVLTSSWREHWDKDAQSCDDTGIEINNIFEKYSLNIFDKTLILDSCREDEIFDWLERNLEVTNFVVLDDRFLDSKRLGEHFIKTNGYSKGLDEESVKKAIEILNM